MAHSNPTPNADSRDTAELKSLCSSLRDSGLMDGDTIQRLFKSFGPRPPSSADELANELMRRKKLTPFQYECLKAGNVKNLKIDQYTVLDLIGDGGMGQVFKAVHERMQRTVALKIISNKLLDSSEALDRFEQEARAAAQLSHPNIVAAYDAGERDGTHYLVMEYVDGQDLATIVHRNGPLRVPIAIDYILQAAEGLQYSHRKGIIHRDIKPGNMLVDSTGLLKILDMGLAFFTESSGIGATTNQRLTQHGQIMGTSTYMAPEQALDVRKADARSDVYALGCTLYDLLVGKPPYAGETNMAILVAHREQPIPSICVERPEVSPAIDAVYQKMVAKKPADRFASMGEVIAALRACTGQVLGGTFPAGATGTDNALSAGSSNEAAVATSPQTAAVAVQAQPTAPPVNDTFRINAAKADTVIGMKRVGSAIPPMALWSAGLLIGLAVVGSAAWGVILSLQTPQGSLVVESDDPNVKVVVKQGGNLVDIIDADDDWKVRLNEGQYELELSGGRDKVKLEDNVVTISRKKTERLRVVFKPTEVAAVAPDAKPAPQETQEEETTQATHPPSNRSFSVNLAPEPTTSPSVDAIPKLTLVHSLEGRRDDAPAIAFSPDGKELASFGREGHVLIWNVESGEVARQFMLPIGGGGIAYSPDGKKLALCGDNLAAAIYDAEKGTLIHLLNRVSDEEVERQVEKSKLYPLMDRVVFSPDGERLLGGSNLHEMYVWNVETGELLVKKEAHLHAVYDVAWSPDGRRIATCSYDGTTQLWNAENYEKLHNLRHERESTVFECLFSKDSATLYTAGNTTDVVAWDVETGAKLKVMHGHGGPIIGLTLSNDDQMLISTSNFDRSMRFWDVASGQALSVLRNGDPLPFRARFSPVDPKLFAYSTDFASVRLMRYEGEQAGETGNVRKLSDGTIVIHQEVADDHLVAPPWQSFRPTVDGKLLIVELQPCLAEGTKGQLNIYQGEGRGGEQLHTQPYTMGPYKSSPWETFKLTQPLDLKKGEVYTVELSGAVGMYHSNTDRYGDGRASRGADMAFRLYFQPEGE